MSESKNSLPFLPTTALGIFAHPDDEAFGPGGTLVKLVRAGTKVHLLCVTDGGDINREEELRQSARIVGITTVTFLHYPDGGLNNQLYHEIAGKITNHINRLQPDLLITFEMRGVSGHIDHSAVAFYTSYAFEHTTSPKELWYYCHDQKHRDALDRVLGKNGYFIYFPPGYANDQIDFNVNVSQVWNTKVSAMRCHQSQIKDVNNILKMYETIPKVESFLIKKR